MENNLIVLNRYTQNLNERFIINKICTKKNQKHLTMRSTLFLSAALLAALSSAINLDVPSMSMASTYNALDAINPNAKGQGGAEEQKKGGPKAGGDKTTGTNAQGNGEPVVKSPEKKKVKVGAKITGAGGDDDDENRKPAGV